MAQRAHALAGNAPGDWFVDRACIDCDTCRQLAPATFVEADGHALVAAQPQHAEERAAAARAALSCPTGAIGAGADAPAVRAAADALPWALDATVAYCGYTSARSYGASSYLLTRPEGRWMIDAPRWVPGFAETLHRDDCADAARYAAHCGARRYIHAADADAQPDAEVQLTGEAPHPIAPGLTVVPVPGHTAGSIAVVDDQGHAFTGDHCWWSRRQGRLTASRDVCWYSWSAQAASMARLAEHPCTTILPGHGMRASFPSPGAAREALLALASRMQVAGARDDW